MSAEKRKNLGSVSRERGAWPVMGMPEGFV